MKPTASYSLWLKRRLEYADGLTREARAVEIARVRASVVDFKARNLDGLGAAFYDGMLAELDGAPVPAPDANIPSFLRRLAAPDADKPEVGAFD